jgi:predicted oxidoreductase
MTAKVNKIPISANGPAFSRLIYGTWRLLDTPDASLKTPKAILARLKECVKLGITTIDLADIYGGGHHQCEKAFGEALRLEPSLRQQLQLVTKCGIRCDYPKDSPPSVIKELEANGLVAVKHYDTSKEYILKRVEESLNACGVDYFDLLLIHRPDPFMNADEVAEAMKQLKAEGKVLHFGVSNFNVHQVELLQSRLEFDIVTNQIEFSCLHVQPLYDGVLEQCQKLRMHPMIWSPLAGGKLFTDFMHSDSSEAVRIMRVQTAIDKVAKELSSQAGKAVTRDQVAFAWLFAHPVVTFPILGTSNMERIQSAVAALNLKMSRMQWFEILEACNGVCVP